MTRGEINISCEKFKPGDKVLIPETVKEEDGKKSMRVKTEGTVIERYPHFLLILKGNFLECFTYTDIALFGAIEKIKERKRRGA